MDFFEKPKNKEYDIKKNKEDFCNKKANKL